jgi:hypothetical protein
MITLRPSLNLCFSRHPNLTISGSLILIKILEVFSFSGFLGGRCILASFQKSSPLNLLKPLVLFKIHFKTDMYGSKFSPIMHFIKKIQDSIDPETVICRDG